MVTAHRFTARLEDDDRIVASADTEYELVPVLRRHASGTHFHVIHTDCMVGRIEFELVDDYQDDVDTVVYLVDEDPDWEPAQ